MNELEFDDFPSKGNPQDVTKEESQLDSGKELAGQSKGVATVDIKPLAADTVMAAEKRPRLLFDEWRHLTKETILKNFYSAITLSFLTFPFALVMVLSINEIAPEPILTYAGSVMTNIIGFVSVLIYSKGPMLFRTFTGGLFPILADSVEQYGKEGLATSSLYIILLLILGIFFNLFRVIKYIPFFIFEGVKIGTGFLLIFTEVYSLIGIKSKGSDVNLLNFLSDLKKNSDHIKVGELLVCLILGFISFLFQKKFKQFPWAAVIFSGGIIYGYFMNETEQTNPFRVKLLRDLAQSEFEQNKSSLFDFDKDFIPAAFRGIRHPMIFINAIGLVIMILFEVCISIAINEDHFEKKVKRKQEFFGVTVANCVCFLFGVLPVAVPIGRIQFLLETGADHKIMNAFCIVNILILYLVFFSATGYMPICILKAMNVMINLSLIKFSYVRAFHKYSYHYTWAMALIILGMLLFNMAWCIIISALIFFAVLFTQIKDEPIEYVDHGEGHVEVTLKGRFVFMKHSIILTELKTRNAQSVTINFSKCIGVEINYMRNYKLMIGELEKTIKEVRVIGLEKGKSTANLKNMLLYKLPYFKKYLSQKG